jgi:hypothetical protein
MMMLPYHHSIALLQVVLLNQAPILVIRRRGHSNLFQPLILTTRSLCTASDIRPWPSLEITPLQEWKLNLTFNSTCPRFIQVVSVCSDNSNC